VDDEELAEAMKERGLGTPATRAAIIEKLLKEKYLVREGKELTPTGKAFELLSLLEAMKIDVLASPELTGEWEYKLNQILKGKFTRLQFMQEIRSLTTQITSRIKNFEENRSRKPAAFSPVNGLKIYETPTSYISDDGTTNIRKILGGRMMREHEIMALFRGETVGPFSDFRSKKGKPFSASIRLVDNKVEFIFSDTTDHLDLDTVFQQDPLGLSPIDETPVYETSLAYMSKSALHNDEKNGLRISKIILSKPITPDIVQQLLSKRKTPLIKGFISKKRKSFDAYLTLDDNGRVGFEFPPRRVRRKSKKR
jgi:DNA topoisomerase-3